MRIPYLGKNFNEYRKIFQLKMLELEITCTVCGSKTHRHGGYWRNAWCTENTKKEKLWIVRVRCANEGCGTTHALIPDFLIPFKKYVASEVEEAVMEQLIGPKMATLETEAEESTIRRWWRQYKERTAKAANELEALLMKEHSKMVSLLKADMVGVKRLKILIERFPQILSTCVFGAANQWMNAAGLPVYL
jgi:hypothetical protein